ncbi:hypothetical protein H9P43_003790 [Blastocladiella emersonii ATCC 22665]|nr:hypothetical protein H9P43_003790 [Blastocladiella emersonii ATCC 22665]
MKLIPSRLLLALVACVAVFATAARAHEVVEIDDTNFGALIESPPAGTPPATWFLEFYAPWCGFCRRFESQYEDFAAKVGEIEPSVKVGRVNVDKAGITTLRFLISRLPTVYHINGKEVRELSKVFTTDALLDVADGESWREVDPWHWIWSPFSYFGTLLYVLGWLSSSLNAATAYLGQFMPMWAVGIVILGALLVVSMLVVTFVPNPLNYLLPTAEEYEQEAAALRKRTEALKAAAAKKTDDGGEAKAEKEETTKATKASAPRSPATTVRRRRD